MTEKEIKSTLDKSSDIPIIQISEMHKWFGDFHVLIDINLEVERGERIVVCGPSGSGKSTMIRCINRLEKQIVVLKWMMGVMLAGVVSLVLKAFFMP